MERRDGEIRCGRRNLNCRGRKQQLHPQWVCSTGLAFQWHRSRDVVEGQVGEAIIRWHKVMARAVERLCFIPRKCARNNGPSLLRAKLEEMALNFNEREALQNFAGAPSENFC